MSLYSLDPSDFAQTDLQMEQAEKREEWPLLHGDAEPYQPSKGDKLCPQDPEYTTS